MPLTASWHAHCDGPLDSCPYAGEDVFAESAPFLGASRADARDRLRDQGFVFRRDADGRERVYCRACAPRSRGPRTHYVAPHVFRLPEPLPTLCGERRARVVTSTHAEVTCRRCLHLLAREALT